MKNLVHSKTEISNPAQDKLRNQWSR